MLNLKSFSKSKKFLVGLLFAAIAMICISCGFGKDPFEDNSSSNNNSSSTDTTVITAPVLIKVEKANKHLCVNVYGDFSSNTSISYYFYYNTKNDSSTATQVSIFQVSGGSGYKQIELPDYGTYYIWAKKEESYTKSDFSNGLQFKLAKPTADITLQITQQQSAVDYSGQKNCTATISKNATENRSIEYKVLYNSSNTLTGAKEVWLSENNVGRFTNSFKVDTYGSYYFWVKITLLGEDNISEPITASITETYNSSIINQAVTFN